MRAVRKQDRRCRVPWCNGKVNGLTLPLDVCHARHRGMGGGALERTTPEGLILLCRRCHGEYDAGKLDIVPLNEQLGLRSFCEFRMDEDGKSFLGVN